MGDFHLPNGLQKNEIPTQPTATISNNKAGKDDALLVWGSQVGNMEIIHVQYKSWLYVKEK